jgi:FkbM family methyltransferase
MSRLNAHPTKQNTLSRLKNRGLNVATVLDVGVKFETLELRQAFPDLKHFLFEPVEEYFADIRRNYRGLDYELVPQALSDKQGEDLLTITKMGSDLITHSSLDGELGGEVSETRKITVTTLDNFLGHRECPKPYLLKLDVDGHEMPILRGAEEALKQTSCVVIEAPLCYLSERVKYLESKGFHLWDIVDLCYYYGNLHQVDLIFLSDAQKRKAPFSPWENFEFDWAQWQEFSQTN